MNRKPDLSTPPGRPGCNCEICQRRRRLRGEDLTVCPPRPSPPFTFGADVFPGLAKLVEECGETVQVGGKLMMTVGAERHWDGSNLRRRLSEEVGDLLAAVTFMREHKQLDEAVIAARLSDKIALFRQWREEQRNRP